MQHFNHLNLEQEIVLKQIINHEESMILVPWNLRIQS